MFLADFDLLWGFFVFFFFIVCCCFFVVFFFAVLCSFHGEELYCIFGHSIMLILTYSIILISWIHSLLSPVRQGRYYLWRPLEPLCVPRKLGHNCRLKKGFSTSSVAGKRSFKTWKLYCVKIVELLCSRTSLVVMP